MSQTSIAAAASDIAGVASRLHELGPRALAEFLVDVGATTGSIPEVLEIAGRYTALSPAVVRAVGGHRFAPFSVIHGGRQ